ncbi:hypothetical protein C9374_012085 [Naegleria lovaniensis]|uniref:Uncharacterized protein n=1 Tax=Naegleria lovaniensis TaxID=51637 RepID=A0AA88GDQ8_NAELO|nr:uncharacterized protein C9374_012085 [Naegleria lovaniensis]KAG2373478.1 hypothetical protein C9374_012085 [Naegleria lovaniensis]
MNNQSREENNSNNPRFTSSHHPFLQPIFPPNPNLFTQQNPSSQPIFPPNPAIFSPNLSFQPGFPPPWIPLNPFSPQLYPIISPFPPSTSEQTSTKDQESPKLEHVDKSSVTNINPIKSPNPTREIEKTFQNSKRVLVIKEQPQMICKHPYQKRSMMERIDKWRKLKGVGGFGGFSIPPYIPMAQIKFSPYEHTLSDHYKCEEERAKKKKKIAFHWQRLEVLKDVSTVDKFGDLLRTAYLERGISEGPFKPAAAANSRKGRLPAPADFPNFVEIQNPPESGCLRILAVVFGFTTNKIFNNKNAKQQQQQQFRTSFGMLSLNEMNSNVELDNQSTSTYTHETNSDLHLLYDYLTDIKFTPSDINSVIRIFEENAIRSIAVLNLFDDEEIMSFALHVKQ